MKTEWHPRRYKRYPGWAIRRIVTGGYWEGGYYYTKTKEGWNDKRRNTKPYLVRYEITYQGQYFFSMPSRKEAFQILKKYARLRNAHNSNDPSLCPFYPESLSPTVHNL